MHGEGEAMDAAGSGTSGECSPVISASIVTDADSDKDASPSD